MDEHNTTATAEIGKQPKLKEKREIQHQTPN
jgi:hypothetical protein